MLGVITLNAIVLGAETYENVERATATCSARSTTSSSGSSSSSCAIRLTATLPRPAQFFRSGWNVFDFVVVAGSFLPGLRENATLLRLLRLGRVARIVRFLPDLRVIIAAVARSVPGVSSLAVATLLLVYLYGMVGWLIFDDHDPEHFGNVGQAMITMFVLLTLENLPVYIETGQDLSQWTIIFFVSYVLVASFLIFNLFIGIVLNSMEGARAEEAPPRARARARGRRGQRQRRGRCGASRSRTASTRCEKRSTRSMTSSRRARGSSESMRVHIVDPPAYTPPYDHALSAALAEAGLDVTLVSARFAHGDVPAPRGYRVDERFYGGTERLPAARGPRRAWRATCPTCCATGARRGPPTSCTSSG